MSQDGQAREIDQAVETVKESDLVGITSAEVSQGSRGGIGWRRK